MKRNMMNVRADHYAHLEQSCNFFYHSDEELELPYWDESAAYQFTAKEIDELEKAADTVYEMAVATVDELIQTQRLDKLYIPEKYHQMIEASWNRELGRDKEGNPIFSDPSMIGRFDFTLDENGVPKVLEFNADTPTSLLEAAVVQGEWLETNGQTPKGSEQYNMIHEKMVAGWQWLKTNNVLKADHIHFTAMSSFEDMSNAAYAEATAKEAGYKTTLINCEDIGVQKNFFGTQSYLVDLDNKDIKVLYKLYPWEQMLDDTNPVLRDAILKNKKTQFIEPVWKMTMSNKALLGLMWEKYGQTCPYLLPTYNDNGELSEQKIIERLENSYAKKPVFSREGANVTLVENGQTICEEKGDYGAEGFIYQKLSKLQSFDATKADLTTEKRHPVLGVWMIGGEAAGMGIRESNGLITGNMSYFVPHYFN